MHIYLLIYLHNPHGHTWEIAYIELLKNGINNNKLKNDIVKNLFSVNIFVFRNIFLFFPIILLRDYDSSKYQIDIIYY